jgi:hypothetical protein
VVIMDQAGWHKARALIVPDNITILYLPPYSPELNPVERLWAYLRGHYLSNRVFDDYQHLLDAGADAWRHLSPELLRTVCACPYLTPELERRFVLYHPHLEQLNCRRTHLDPELFVVHCVAREYEGTACGACAGRPRTRGCRVNAGLAHASWTAGWSS